jgi:aspartyl-tRNA(Asn)/glutamyl-tRNA(Gln) amidotransferase subunit A
VPKSGCTPLGYSLDHIGPLARTAKDCAAMLDAIAGYHPSDADSADVSVPEYLAALRAFDGSLEGVRIGVDRVHTFAPGVDPAVAPLFEAALEALASRGATLVDVSLPYYAEMMAVCMVTMCGEALAYHANDLCSRWGEYFAGTRAMISNGALANAADFVQAQRVRRVVQHDLLAMFAGVDAIATPTSGLPAPTYTAEESELTFSLGDFFSQIHTFYWDPTGCPSMVMPMGFNADGLPLSLQFGGRPFEESVLLKIAEAFQQETEWHREIPPLARELQAV